MSTTLNYRFTDEVWVDHTPNAKLYFVSMPKDTYEELLDLVGTSLNPWGTVPCYCTIGDYRFYTAMFPRKVRKCYDVPLNLKTRKRLKVEEGQTLQVLIEIELPIGV